MRIIWIFCAIFAGISMIMDVKWEKVFNFWIVLGWTFSFVFRLLEGDQMIGDFFSGAVLPVAILFPLFLFKMIGTGDIKVFSVLGSGLGDKLILQSMILSLFLAGVIAFPVLIFRCDWKERFRYFFSYVEHFLQTKSYEPYLVPGRRPENIHFTIPIFCSVVVIFFKEMMYFS